MSTGLRSGLLMALIGAFLIMRTITQDHTGRTLIDRLLGRAGSGAGSIPDPTGQLAATADQPGGINDPTGTRSAKTQKLLGQPTDKQIAQHFKANPTNPLAGLVPFAGAPAFKSLGPTRGARAIR